MVDTLRAAYLLTAAMDAATDVAKASSSLHKIAAAAACASGIVCDTDAGAMQLSIDTALADVLAVQAAAIAAQEGIVATTPLADAIATMVATPNQTNADAVNTIWSTAVTGFEAQIMALDGLINACKNASDTAAVSAAAADDASQIAGTSANSVKNDSQSASDTAITSEADVSAITCDELLEIMAVLGWWTPPAIQSDPRAFEEARMVSEGIRQSAYEQAKHLSTGAEVQSAIDSADRRYWDCILDACSAFGMSSPNTPPRVGAG